MASDMTVGPSENPPSDESVSVGDRPGAISPKEPINKRLEKIWADPPGFFGWFRALQNDVLGGRIMTTAFSFFLIGGILALLMRTQLLWGESEFLSPQTFNELFTMHGSTM